MRKSYKFFNLFNKILGITLFDYESVYTIIYRLTTTAPVSGNNGAGTSAAFQKDIAKSFGVKTGMNGAMDVFQNLMYIVYHPMIDNDAFRNHFVQFTLIFLFAKATNVEYDTPTLS